MTEMKREAEAARAAERARDVSLRQLNRAEAQDKAVQVGRPHLHHMHSWDGTVQHG